MASGWFDDVPAWPVSEQTPASELARALVTAGLVGAVPSRGSHSPEPSWGDSTPTASIPVVTDPEVSERIPAPTEDAPHPPDAAREGARDPFEQMLVRAVPPKRGSGPPRLWKDHRRPILGAAVAVIVLTVAAAVTATQVGGGDSARETTTQAAGPTSATISSTPADACSAMVDGAVTTGHGRGDQKSGAGAILAFNYAYYVERSAAAARSVAAPNAVATASVMQQYINQRAPGTEHCLSITDLGKGTYSVVLTEIPPGPDAETIVYRQQIKTIESRGKFWIAAITSEE